MTSKTKERASSAKLERVGSQKQQERASSAKHLYVPTLNKVELRPMQERKDSQGSIGPRPSSTSLASSHSSTSFPAPTKPPLIPKANANHRLQISAKVSTLELNVDNSNRSKSQMVRMAGNALTRPSSASYSSSGKMYRPVSAKVAKTPTSETIAGRRPGTVTGHSTGMLEGPPPDGHFPPKTNAAAALMQAQLSAIDSENSFVDELRAHNRPSRTESGGERVTKQSERGSGLRLGGGEGMQGLGMQDGADGAVQGAERGFDFTTMEELGREDGNRDWQELRDPKTGRVLPSTGIAKDTHKTMRLFSGQLFDPNFGDNDDVSHAKMKYGFRSQALKLEVKLTERLRLATDEAHRFEIIRELFERVVKVDANFGDILGVIKAAYDERLDLVPTADGDSVAMGAYNAQKSKLEGVQERKEALEAEVRRLKEEKEEMRVACELLEERLSAARGDEEGSESEEGEGVEHRVGGRGGGEEAAALRAQVEALTAQLGAEAAARERVEAALDGLAAANELGAVAAAEPAGSGERSAREGRDTARSAASGYDDHPTHRPTSEAAVRPPSVPAISKDNWDKVQESRAEEAAEEAAWQEQEAAQAEGYYYEDQYGEYGPEGEWVQQYYDGEYDEEDEEVRRQLEAAGYAYGGHGSEGYEDQSGGRGSPHSREESMAVARPTSKLSHGMPGGGGAEEEDFEEFDEMQGRGEAREEDGGEQDWEEEQSHDTFSASEQTLSPGESNATSFVDSARSQRP